MIIFGIGVLILLAILILLIVIAVTKPAVLVPDADSLALSVEGKGEGQGYIVVLKDQEHCSCTDIDECCKTHKCEHTHVFEHGLKGFSAHLTAKQLRTLRKDPKVMRIEKDAVVSLPKPVENISALATPQTTGWNIKREGGIYTGSISKQVHVYVLDSGISVHPDLNVASRVSFISSNPSGIDQNSHGTHCAGLVGAINNTIDVVGVAPGVELNGVQVLDKNGSGSLSGVINGINYVIQQKKTKYAKEAVIMNLSLGMQTGTTAYNAMDNAVQAAINAGVIVCIAAGNSSSDVKFSSPSRVSSAIVVGSYGSSNKFSYFSNFGSGVSVLAPGENILSTVPGNTTAFMSGSSMSTPQAAGWCALYLSQPGNLLKTQSQVRAAITSIPQNSSNPAITGVRTGTTNKSVYINFTPAPTPTPTYLHSCSYCRHT